MAIPILPDIVRQHVEEAAHLWTIYDAHMLDPEANEEMDEVRLARLTERLNAHIDGVRVAGEDGIALAEAAYAKFPEAGELFVLRMCQPSALSLTIEALDLDKVRQYIAGKLGEA